MSQRGFTLIELLVVASIISLLSSITLSTINQARTKATNVNALTEFRSVEKALESYYADHGRYPDVPTAFVDDHPVNCPSNDVTHWCDFKAALAPYLGNLRWVYDSPAGFDFIYEADAADNWQTYVIAITMPTNPQIAALAANDGGVYPSEYEIGPQVEYCKKKYGSLPNANWYDNNFFVCYGGN